MPKAAALREVQALTDAVVALSGAIPDSITRLLAAYSLLSSPGSASNPEKDILTAALAGELDAKTLAKLLPAAATAELINNYRGDLSRRSEHVLLGEVHRQLDAGGADKILDSLRPGFDTHAKAIQVARGLIDPQSSVEHVLASGTPELVTAWQSLDGHIRAVAAITAVAAQFGCRSAPFGQVREYSNATDGWLVHDSALMAGSGDLVAESAMFGRPDQGHRTSPFFRIQLRLNTVAEATQRYNDFAADQWDATHAGSPGGWIDTATGQMHEHPRQRNPYRAEVNA